MHRVLKGTLYMCLQFSKTYFDGQIQLHVLYLSMHYIKLLA